MEYEIKKSDDQIVFLFKEKEIFDNFNERPYSEIFVELVKEGKDVTLDFSEVTVVDSLFIGSIIVLKKSLELKKKKMVMQGLNDHLKDLFSKLNLTEFFAK